MKTRITSTLAIAALALVACGDDDSQLATEASAEPTSPNTEEAAEPSDDETDEESEETEEAAEEEEEDPDLPTDEEIREFVDAIASSSPGTLTDAQELVADGSPAANYLTYYTHLINADIDGGWEAEADTVSSIDDGFEICTTGGTEDDCATYTEFSGTDGDIFDFLISGNDIQDRLLMGPGETVEGPGGLTIEVISTYLNARGTHTIVAYEMRSGSTGLMSPIVSYRSPEGRQSEASMHSGAMNLSPDSMSHYAVAFPQSELGGDVRFEVFDSNGYDLHTATISLDD